MFSVQVLSLMEEWNTWSAPGCIVQHSQSGDSVANLGCAYLEGIPYVLEGVRSKGQPKLSSHLRAFLHEWKEYWNVARKSRAPT